MATVELLPVDIPRRRLTLAEVSHIAQRVARRAELWQALVAEMSEKRQHEELYTDEHVGVWVITWMPGHDTRFHDHDGVLGSVAVAAGSIREERPVWQGEPRRRIDAPAGTRSPSAKRSYTGW
jgi:predicted metal-dependent enzyme (double-stranded beta helix superfamily)